MRANFIFSAFIFSIFLYAPVFSQPVNAEKDSLASFGCSSCVNLEKERIKYFNDNQFPEFIDFLDKYKGADKFDKSCVNYYKALARFGQLSYLEEKQSWDDYFANGNLYREQIVENIQEVLSKIPAGNCLRIKARLLAWEFHRGQQDAFYEQALTELMDEVKAYAKETKEPQLIKQVADALLLNDQKASARELYQLYVQKLAGERITDLELKSIAAGFYKEKNLELAQTVYDIYIQRTQKSLAPDKFIVELFEIASMFVYKPSGSFDMAYAEKVYKIIADYSPKNVFNQEQIYLRAYNLEKMMEYASAREFYLQLNQLFADTKHFDEAAYKIAMIDAYALADIKEARSAFEKLSIKSPVSVYVNSSLYQLGLLSQWEGDLAKAKEYYSALLNNLKDAPDSIVTQAKERLSEIEGNKSLSYNLKTFLDLSFKDTGSSLEMGQSELTASSYSLEKDQKIAVLSSMNMPESGCNQVELRYLWSGDLGQAAPGESDSNFECAYSDIGTKAINMLIVTPSGTLDRAFMMVDVY